MAQFDPLIISPIICSLLFVLTRYYILSLEILIPAFFENQKLENKLLNS